MSNFKLTGLKIDKINNYVLKAYNKGYSNKDRILIDVEEIENGFNNILVSMGGYNIFSICDCFFPFSVDAITDSIQNNRIEKVHFVQGFNNEKDTSKDEKVMYLYDVKNEKDTVCIFGNDNFKLGVNKKYLDYVNIENCEFFGSGLKKPLKVFCRHELVSIILPINPAAGNWER